MLSLIAQNLSKIQRKEKMIEGILLVSQEKTEECQLEIAKLLLGYLSEEEIVELIGKKVAVNWNLGVRFGKLIGKTLASKINKGIVD